MKFAVLLSILSTVFAIPTIHTGIVGPSGVIGPSGLVGPSGPVQFNQPAWAFLGNDAHAHIAALNAHKAAHRAALAALQRAPAVVPAAIPSHVQSAPPGAVYGIDSAGCVVGPSGKVCPTGNVQFS